jgi:hypothetical protein
MAPGSRGVGAVFVHFSGEDSDQTGDAIGEPRVPRRSWVAIFPTHPGSRINLLRAGKTLRAKAAVREEKRVFLPARFSSNLVPVRAHILPSSRCQISTFLVSSESLRCLILQGSGFAEIRAWTCEI